LFSNMLLNLLAFQYGNQGLFKFYVKMWSVIVAGYIEERIKYEDKSVRSPGVLSIYPKADFSTMSSCHDWHFG
jgi:hypothetical protein